jgi:hypothetical protein
VRFLIDNALSPVVGQELNRAGHDTVHVVQYLLSAAASMSDDEKAEQEWPGRHPSRDRLLAVGINPAGGAGLHARARST